MAHRTFAILGTLALLTAASAFGQQALTADVPFEFHLGDKAMPAGHYDVTHTSNLLYVSCVTTGVSAMALPIGIGSIGGQNTPSRLVFKKYGDKYFLSEVWAQNGAAWAAALSMSKAERELARTPSEVSLVTIPARTGVLAFTRAR